MISPQETLFPGNLPLSNHYKSLIRKIVAYIYTTVFLAAARKLFGLCKFSEQTIVWNPPKLPSPLFYCMISPQETLFPGNLPLSNHYESLIRKIVAYIYTTVFLAAARKLFGLCKFSEQSLVWNPPKLPSPLFFCMISPQETLFPGNLPLSNHYKSLIRKIVAYIYTTVFLAAARKLFGLCKFSEQSLVWNPPKLPSPLFYCMISPQETLFPGNLPLSNHYKSLIRKIVAYIYTTVFLAAARKLFGLCKFSEQSLVWNPPKLPSPLFCCMISPQETLFPGNLPLSNHYKSLIRKIVAYIYTTVFLAAARKLFGLVNSVNKV